MTSPIRIPPPLLHPTPGVGLKFIKIETPNLIGLLQSDKDLFTRFLSDPKNILGATTGLLSISSGVQNEFGQRFLDPLYKKRPVLAVFGRIAELSLNVPLDNIIGLLNHEMGHILEDKVFESTPRALQEREIGQREIYTRLSPEDLQKRLACKPQNPVIHLRSPFEASTQFYCRYDNTLFANAGGLNQNEFLARELWLDKYRTGFFTPQTAISSILAMIQGPIYVLKTQKEVPSNEIGLRQASEIRLIPGSRLLPPGLEGNDIYSFAEHARKQGAALLTSDLLPHFLWNLGNFEIYEAFRCGIDFISKGKRACKPLLMHFGRWKATPPHLGTYLIAHPNYDGFTNEISFLLMHPSAGLFEMSYQFFLGANRENGPLTTQEAWNQAIAKGPRIKYQASGVRIGYSKQLTPEDNRIPKILFDLGIEVYLPPSGEPIGVSGNFGASISPHPSVEIKFNFQYSNGRDPLNSATPIDGKNFYRGGLNLILRPLLR